MVTVTKFRLDIWYEKTIAWWYSLVLLFSGFDTDHSVKDRPNDRQIAIWLIPRYAKASLWKTSCRRETATICRRPGLRAWWHDIHHTRIWIGHKFDVHVSLPVAQYSQPKRPGDLWPFDLESGVRVTCDVGYLCAKFSLPRPLSSRLRPDVRDRQTSDSIIV